MFKNETIVKMVLVGLLSGPFYYSAHAASDEAKISDRDAMYKDVCITNYNKAKCDKLQDVILGGTGDGCSNSAKNFNDANKEFTEACGVANLPTNSGSQPGLACSAAVMKCMTLRESGKSTSAEKTYKTCPPLAAQDLKELKDEADKARKHIDELQDKMPDLEQKKTDAGNQYADKLSEISDQARDAQSKYSEAIAQASKDRGQAVQSLREKVNQYNDDINKSQQQIVENAQGLYKAQTDYQVSVHQINATCFTQAQQQATAERARYAAAGNPFPSMTSIFKKQGMSDQKWWDSRAQYFYNRCRAMKITTDQLADVASTRDAAVQSVNNAAAVIQNQISQTQAKIRQTGLQTGCFGNTAGPGGETEMCGIIRDLNQANQRAQQELANNIGSGKQAAQRAASQAAQASNSADQQIQALNQKIASEQTRLNSLTADLEQRSRYATNSDSNANTNVGLAMGKFNTLVEAAAQRELCCSKPNSFDTDCTKPMNFLSSVGQRKDRTAIDDMKNSSGAAKNAAEKALSLEGTNGNPGSGSR